MCLSLGYGLNFLFMTTTPVIRSKLSKLVDSSQQGKPHHDCLMQCSTAVCSSYLQNTVTGSSNALQTSSKPPELDAKLMWHHPVRNSSRLEEKPSEILSHHSNRCLICGGRLRGESVFPGGHLPLQRPVPSNAALDERLPLPVRCLAAADPCWDNGVSLLPSHHCHCTL